MKFNNDAEEAKFYLTHDEVKEYHDNGKIAKHYFLMDDKLDGEYKQYHSNGRLEVHTFCRDGLPDGEYKQFSFNGTLINHCFYKNGIESSIEWIKEFYPECPRLPKKLTDIKSFKNIS